MKGSGGLASIFDDPNHLPERTGSPRSARRWFVHLGEVVAIAAWFLTFVYLMSGAGAATRQALESFSAAENRCESLYDKPLYGSCVEKEMKRPPLALGPEAGRTAMFPAAAGVAGLLMARAGREDTMIKVLLGIGASLFVLLLGVYLVT